ncbi:hypothetical protein TNCV_2199311 [Trichonephila clavipes]|nr:hypothetical protein TNCV_2199311 [Trichonephila clavipes]
MLVRVYENQALSMECDFKWFARFREASDSIRREEPASSISDKNIEKPGSNPQPCVYEADTLTLSPRIDNDLIL